MVIATNQMAAVQFSSAPYLTVVAAEAVRSSCMSPPFRFTPLRGPPVGDQNETAPPSDDPIRSSGPISAEETPPLLGTFPLKLPIAEDEEPPDSLVAIDGAIGPRMESSETIIQIPSVTQSNLPVEVSLEDLLPFFPGTEPTSSRATYRQK